MVDEWCKFKDEEIASIMSLCRENEEAVWGNCEVVPMETCAQPEQQDTQPRVTTARIRKGPVQAEQALQHKRRKTLLRLRSAGSRQCAGGHRATNLPSLANQVRSAYWKAMDDMQQGAYEVETITAHGMKQHVIKGLGAVDDNKE